MSNEEDRMDYLFKLVLIGDSGVGKTSLLLKYVDNVFTETFISTIGVDFKIKTIVVNGYSVKLQIWDTAGQERFKNIVSTFYRNAHSIIIVYDVTEMESFMNVERWLSEVDRFSGNRVQKTLVGNKSDLASRRVVSLSAGRSLAEKANMTHLEVSSKTSENVEKLFSDIITTLMTIEEPISPTKPNLFNKSLPKRHAVQSGGICNC